MHRLDRDTEVKVAKPAAARGRPSTPSGDRATRVEGRSTKPSPRRSRRAATCVRMDQPYSRMVDMMLDTQYYSTADPRPYDDTGWTFGPLRTSPPCESSIRRSLTSR